MSADEVHKLARDLFSQARGDPNRLATIAAQFQLEAQKKTGRSLSVSYGVSFKSHEPYVQLDWGAETGQVTVESARSHAQAVLEAAQNGVADAAIFAWGIDTMKLDESQAAHLIDALRTYRSDRWGQPDLELEFGKPPPEPE